MDRKNKPFGRRTPESIRVTSFSEEYRRGELENRQIRNVEIPKSLVNKLLVVVIFMGIGFAIPESRALASEMFNFVVNIGKNWFLKGTIE